MAFQQPQRQQPRPATISTAPIPIQTSAPLRQQTPPPERQEWVLFSPPPPSETLDNTESTVRTDHITGQLSDFGSLETAAISDRVGERDREGAETEDLDSLDDGLHAFNESASPLGQRRHVEDSAESVMPAHDGLGMFPGSSSPLHDQFWQYERYNPRRRRSMRRSSLQKKVESMEEERSASSKEDEKTQRIEQWREEQSKAIFEEIERETKRRRRRSKLSVSKAQGSNPIAQSAPEATVPIPTPEPTRTERLSFWERLTRRVIRDLIGIDDATLEFIFGESLPEEPPKPAPAPSAASAIVDYAERAIRDDEVHVETSSWDQRLLARIAKELGILFTHISEHPGAFSTYLRTQEVPPYAGLPHPEPKQRTKPAPKPEGTEPIFAPTMGRPQHHHRRHSTMTMDPSLWGIEEEDEEAARAPSAFAEAARLKREKEYWEQDLDVKMVFNFLRNRLTSSTDASPATTTRPPFASTQSAAQNQADSLRRAALIRHHHPLVSRTSTGSSPQQPTLQRTRSGNSTVLSSGAPLSPILGRRGSRGADTESCASQSTKRSRTGRSGSSRNYWDLGGRSDGGSDIVLGSGAGLGWGVV